VDDVRYRLFTANFLFCRISQQPQPNNLSPTTSAQQPQLNNIEPQINNIATISINRTQPLSASTNSDYPNDPVEYLDHFHD
jgi:hypothetical protein